MVRRHAMGATAGSADDGTPGVSARVGPSSDTGARLRTPAPPTLADALETQLATARPVARGATSQVFRLTHPRLGCDVAVKVLDERHRDDDALDARLEREARAVATIRDPGVVRVLDLCRLADGRPALVSEWLEGEDLETLLRRAGALDLDTALRIARDVALALAAAHEAGVLHRDVKPSNILLVNRERYGRSAVLLDFGVARCASEASDTATGGLLGTPAYMAPEQARDASRVDARADVYATSALLFRMIAGEPPYEPGDPWSTLERLATAQPRSLAALAPDVPAEVVALVERGLCRDPALRPPNARELVREIEALWSPSEPRRTPPVSQSSLGTHVRVGAAVAAFVSGIVALVSSAITHPLRPEGAVLLLVLGGVGLAVAWLFLDRERQRGGGPSTARARLDGLARTALVGFATPSGIALVGGSMLASFDLCRRPEAPWLLGVGLVGLVSTLGVRLQRDALGAPDARGALKRRAS